MPMGQLSSPGQLLASSVPKKHTCQLPPMLIAIQNLPERMNSGERNIMQKNLNHQANFKIKKKKTYPSRKEEP